jgi:hypothetical protein
MHKKCGMQTRTSPHAIGCYTSVFSILYRASTHFQFQSTSKEIQLYCKDKTTQQLQDEILNDPVLKDG